MHVRSQTQGPGDHVQCHVRGADCKQPQAPPHLRPESVVSRLSFPFLFAVNVLSGCSGNQEVWAVTPFGDHRAEGRVSLGTRTLTAFHPGTRVSECPHAVLITAAHVFWRAAGRMPGRLLVRTQNGRAQAEATVGPGSLPRAVHRTF